MKFGKIIEKMFLKTNPRKKFPGILIIILEYSYTCNALSPVAANAASLTASA